MKKISRQKRHIDVKNGIIHRKGKRKQRRKTLYTTGQNWLNRNQRVNALISNGLKITSGGSRNLTIHLPEIMNFSDAYDETILYITAIRRLSETSSLPYKAYRLTAVNFDNLKTISTSAALVLTAELSKWDDSIRQRLRPMTENWDPNIFKQFLDLGFFDLFSNPPTIRGSLDRSTSSRLNIVKYIKGKCGDSKKARILKEGITKIVGDEIDKWTFLRGGLDEAVTNVSHHAYPKNGNTLERDKNWYLTGSYNDDTKELKIVFYDQGIGIPRSLPASTIWEKALDVLAKFSTAERKRDEVLLKAAVELDRTSTKQSDRGKGLQDMLEFIRQRGDGYLSILSLKGLYKFSIQNGKTVVKSVHFDKPMLGTLIIWSATLRL